MELPERWQLTVITCLCQPSQKQYQGYQAHQRVTMSTTRECTFTCICTSHNRRNIMTFKHVWEARNSDTAHAHACVHSCLFYTCAYALYVALTAAYVSTAALLKPGLVSCLCRCQTAPSLTSRPLPARLLPGKNAVPSCKLVQRLI